MLGHCFFSVKKNIDMTHCAKRHSSDADPAENALIYFYPIRIFIIFCILDLFLHYCRQLVRGMHACGIFDASQRNTE